MARSGTSGASGASGALPVDLGRPVDVVARDLLGLDLVSTVGGALVVVRLTEVEAYAGVAADPGSHAHRGPTARNEVMFGPPGRAYVYRVYGLHWMLNLVAEPVGHAAAVLLRAGRVVEGAELARDRRALPASRPDRDLARGPATLAQALGVTDAEHGSVLGPAGPLDLGPGAPAADDQVVRSVRVGLGRDDGRAWRMHVAGDPTVSPWRPGRTRARQWRP